MHPFYIELHKSGELLRRYKILSERLSSCDICPRQCKVNRYENGNGFCQSGHLVSIASYCPHHGEEPAISGYKGSGTIFFSKCNLRCIYCQNYQISQGNKLNSRGISSSNLSDIMLTLQNSYGCHNINLVSPSHFVPQIVEAIYLAIPRGLTIPIVYNTNAFDSLSTLQMLDGIIDIYLPDIKYASDEKAKKLSCANEYVSHSRYAIKEMYRQVGNLTMDDKGIAKRGLIVRHLILPNDQSDSKDNLTWIAQNISPDVYISLMSQYSPCFNACNEPLISRRITYDEYRAAVAIMNELGITNGWIQELSSAEEYLPDFSQEDDPFK